MGRPEKPISAATGPIAAFAHELRKLRKDAGNPTYREMARVALFSPSVLSSATSGHRLPTLQVTLAFVAACRGDRDEWEHRWRTIAEKIGVFHAGGLGRIGEQQPFVGARFGAIPVALPRPAQLPMRPAEFVGRVSELRRARTLTTPVAGTRLPLVVGGQVGVGKTAFALRLGHELAVDLPDGQLYANLGSGVSPFEAVTGFLQALGVPAGQIPADLTQRLGLYRSLLASRRLLVLLDDACDERQVRPLLAAAPHSQVLVTSCARLLGLEGTRRLELDVLTRDESLAMLGELAGAGRVRAELPAAARIAELCGDLPLALSIAGRKITRRPGQSIGTLAEQLGERGQALGRLSIGDVSMNKRLQVTYQRLAPLAKLVFCHLGRQHGPGVTANKLARVLEMPVEQAEDVLEMLVDAGLLRPATVGGWYAMAPLVRLFAAEQPQTWWNDDPAAAVTVRDDTGDTQLEHLAS